VKYSLLTDPATARLAASRLITAGAYVEVVPNIDGQVSVVVEEEQRDLLDQAAAEVLMHGSSITLTELLVAMQQQLERPALPLYRDLQSLLREMHERLERGKAPTKAGTISLLALADRAVVDSNIAHWYPALATHWNAMCTVLDRLGLKLWGDYEGWHFRWADGHEGDGFAELDDALQAAFSGARVIFAGK